jgi:O-acetyl-ADP-ribose deacetylase (regulator of RNase III)
VRGAPSADDERALARCYQACLDTAARLDYVRTIALCCVSTGVFGFPRAPAARVAVRTVRAWLRAHPGLFDLVVFNVFSDVDRAVYEAALAEAGI